MRASLLTLFCLLGACIDSSGILPQGRRLAAQQLDFRQVVVGVEAGVELVAARHAVHDETEADIAAAALANGVVPSHNVTTELKDIAYIRRDAERARKEFGYLRMWSIHPNQIVPIVEAMRPDFTEVQEAADILIAAQDKHWGPIQHAGKLHDRASYRYYWELLKRARATGMTVPDEAAQRFF